MQASAMRRFADLEMPLAELTLCAEDSHWWMPQRKPASSPNYRMLRSVRIGTLCQKRHLIRNRHTSKSCAQASIFCHPLINAFDMVAMLIRLRGRTFACSPLFPIRA